MNNQQQDILTKRFQTTMIGALHEFEQAFGYLWGHDKDYDELTHQEEHFRVKWEDTRNQILNNGNGQLRKCINDLTGGYDIKYSYKFYKK